MHLKSELSYPKSCRAKLFRYYAVKWWYSNMFRFDICMYYGYNTNWCFPTHSWYTSDLDYNLIRSMLKLGSINLSCDPELPVLAEVQNLIDKLIECQKWKILRNLILVRIILIFGYLNPKSCSLLIIFTIHTTLIFIFYEWLLGHPGNYNLVSRSWRILCAPALALFGLPF